MSVWVDPNLLSIVGVGLASDPDVPDGRHLRWFMGAPLGFPRGGFRLRRHVSRALASWDQTTPSDPLIHQQWTSQSDLGPGPNRRFDSGLTVAKAGPFLYGATSPAAVPQLKLDAPPVTFDFGITGPGTGPFPPGPMLSHPAVFVRLTIVRRRRTGFAFATASYDARGAFFIQDRAGVGFERPGWFPGDLDDVVLTTANGRRIPSSAERFVDVTALSGRDRDALAALRRAGRAPAQHAPLDPNPWVTETLLLRGGWIDHVEIVGTDALLARIQWIRVRDYAGDPAWVDVGRFFLPLTDAPEIYPEWTTNRAKDVVNERLTLALPKRNLPWDDPTLAVTNNLARRYQGETFEAIDEAIRIFLKEQIAAVVPQSDIEVEQTLESTGGEPEPVTARVRPFEHVYGAAADPQIARLLGLMTTDVVDPSGLYDYAIDMNVPPLWVQWALFPREAAQAAEELRARGIDGWKGLELDSRPDICLAMAPAIGIAASMAPDPPADLQARVAPDIVMRPVQAHVELSWRTDRSTAFDNNGRSRVFYTLTRTGAAGDTLIHHVEDESDLLMPHLPTERQPADGRLRLVDREIPEWGPYTWHLRGMDLWGRFSGAASVAEDVRDTIPPPAPTAVVAELHGDAAALAWTDLSIAFDWGDGLAAVAPDLDRFEVHVRQGSVDRAVAGNPATWGHFEHEPGSTASPVIIRWPALTLDVLPPGTTGSISATPIRAEEGGGVRIDARIGRVRAPFDLDQRATVAATVRAIDVFGNAGSFAFHAQATRLSVVPPVRPPVANEVAMASRPDALGTSSFTVAWPDLGAGRVRVLRASAVSLLSASGTDVAQYEALDLGGQAAFLRGLAIVHQQVFTPDHELPYPASAGTHAARFSARETALTVFVIDAISVTEARAPWPVDPHAFVVVAVPRVRLPQTPMVREARGGDRQVTIRIAPDPTGDVVAFRVHRARLSEDAGDLRRMRLVARVEIVAPAPSESPSDVIVEDHEVFADVDYWYSVVALTADGTTSVPSAPMRARPFTKLPPPAPVLLTAARQGATAIRRITCVLPRRDLPVVLQRRQKGRIDWRNATGPHILTGGRIDVSALVPLAVPQGYEISVDDEVAADVNERYVYRLRLNDERGLTAESHAIEETP